MKRRNPLVIISSVVLLASTVTFGTVASASPSAVVGPPPADGSVTDQIIVTFDGSTRDLPRQALEAAAGPGATRLRDFGQRGAIIKLSTPQSGRMLRGVMVAIGAMPGIAAVEADQIMRSIATPPSDQLYGQQWDLTSPLTGPIGIDAEGAWMTTTGSSSIRIAVVDTGIVTHVDLTGRVAAGYDFISDSRIANDGDGRDADASDPGDWITKSESRRGFFKRCPVGDSSWHGTHVAGTIGAAHDGTGIAGINAVSQIIPVRVLGKCGGYTSDIVDGMRWAAGLAVPGVATLVDHAHVLNLSLGGSGSCSSTYQDTISDVRGQGVVVVVAAGNSDANAANYSPASCDGVVTVAATGHAGDRSYYSNYGSAVEIAAPGGDRIADDGDTILSTVNSGATSPLPGQDSYATYQGTSMAAPHVAGIVSLMLSVDDSLRPDQVSAMLQASATPFPAGSSCTTASCGSGIANAAAAVAAASGGSTTTTMATTTSAATTTTTSSTIAPAGPGDFVKLSPADGSKTGRRPTLRWTASSGAASYEVCVDAIINGECDGTWTTINGTSARTSRLDRRITFEWQVRAIGGGTSVDADAGTWFTFRT